MCFEVLLRSVQTIGAPGMSARSAFQARGPATDSARSPILVRVRGMSKVRLSAQRRCDRPDVADVSVARLLM